MASREWSQLDNQEQSHIRSHQTEAPIKLSSLAKSLGLKVLATSLPDGISGEIRPDPERGGSFIIRVNSKDSARRQRFTVAHEIAHFLLHRDQIGNGISDDVLYRSSLSSTREAQANRLAADILMPEALVSTWLDRAKALPVDDIVGFLADKFNVSNAAMKIRLGIP